MRIQEINCIKTMKKELKKPEIMEAISSMNKKINEMDFDFHNIRKSDYFIHDFFYSSNTLFIIYKHKNVRILLEVETSVMRLLIHKTYIKKANHYKYYDDFKEYSRKVV